MRIAILMVLVLCLGTHYAEARKCDLQTLQDKVDNHLSDSTPFKSIAVAHNMKKGIYYFYLYNPDEAKPSNRNMGFRKMALFLCRPVMKSITPVTQVRDRIIKAGVENFQLNYNFRRSRNRALLGMTRLDIKEEKDEMEKDS